jgi:Tol biopolymer transport system component
MRRREAVALTCVLSLLAVGAIGAALSCADDTSRADAPIRLPSREDGGGGDGRAPLPPGEDIPVPPTPVPDCDPKKPFGKPTLVPGFDPTVPLATPRLSLDELTIYFTARDPDGGVVSELGRAERPSRSAPFGPVILMTAQSSPQNDNDPSVALDHLSLWFHSTRSGNAELWFATRTTTTEPFGPPALVPNVNSPTFADAHAYYRAANGGELWFVSQRGGGAYDIYVAKRQGITFADPVLVQELASPAEDWQPAPSEDGLRVLFASTRDGGAGGFDLWFAERGSTTAPFGTPKPIPELNTDGNEFAGWLSPDGCRAYFSSTRSTDAGTHRLWFAERPK